MITTTNLLGRRVAYTDPATRAEVRGEIAVILDHESSVGLVVIADDGRFVRVPQHAVDLRILSVYEPADRHVPRVPAIAPRIPLSLRKKIEAVLELAYGAIGAALDDVSNGPADPHASRLASVYDAINVVRGEIKTGGHP